MQRGRRTTVAYGDGGGPKEDPATGHAEKGENGNGKRISKSKRQMDI